MPPRGLKTAAHQAHRVRFSPRSSVPAFMGIAARMKRGNAGKASIWLRERSAWRRFSTVPCRAQRTCWRP